MARSRVSPPRPRSLSVKNSRRAIPFSQVSPQPGKGEPSGSELFLLSADTQIQIDKEEVNRYHAEFNTETTRKEESFFKACVATDIILLQFGFFLCGEEE